MCHRAPSCGKLACVNQCDTVHLRRLVFSAPETAWFGGSPIFEDKPPVTLLGG
jgi:hypothetical protein